MKLGQSFKGVIQGFFNDYQSLIYVILGISIGIHIFNLAVELLTGINSTELVVKQGLLNVSLSAAYFSTIVMGIILASKKAIRSKFAFPISRRSYAIGHGLMMIYGSMAIVCISIILGFFDLLFSRLLGGIFPSVIVMTNINWTTYVYGTLVSVPVLMMTIAFVYCVFIYIQRWRLISLVGLGVLLLSVIRGLFNPGFVQFMKEAVLLLFISDNVFFEIIKVLIWFLIFNVLAYIPIRKMEVA